MYPLACGQPATALGFGCSGEVRKDVNRRTALSFFLLSWDLFVETKVCIYQDRFWALASPLWLGYSA
jgi:hypothetical protein